MSRPEHESTTPQYSASSPASPPTPLGPDRSHPPNLFDAQALRGLVEEDGPPATEAETAGPWRVREVGPALEPAHVHTGWKAAPGRRAEPLDATASAEEAGLAAESGWAVVAEGGEEPWAVCREREVALLLAAALPGSGRRPRFSLGEPAPPFALLDEGEPAARLPVFHAELVAEASALAAVLRSPASLALLLEAAGAELLDQAGRIVARRLAEQAGGGR